MHDDHMQALGCIGRHRIRESNGHGKHVWTEISPSDLLAQQ
jgi:hypothetical protein